MSIKRIGILTGGGDVPGLNSVIKVVVQRAAEQGAEAIGIRRGWEGLTHLDLSDPSSRELYLHPLTCANTRTIDRRGGTVLHTSRTNPSRMERVPVHLNGTDFQKNGNRFDLTPQVIKNIEQLQLDYLITIGGDDTLSYSARLDSLGVKIIAIPKTMDNDVRNTEYCIGFSTAISRATAAIDRQRTTVGSHERIGIFRIFGRDAGYTALYSAYVTSSRCCIPEFKVNLDRLIELLLREKRENPSNYSIVLLSEGAQWEGYTVPEQGEPDAFGHRKKASVGDALAAEIARRTTEDSIVSDLTYDLRSGDPDFVDKMIAFTFGTMAIDAVLAGKTGLMTALVDGCYNMASIPNPKLGPRPVDVNTMYNTESYRPSYLNRTGLPIFMTRA